MIDFNLNCDLSNSIKGATHSTGVNRKRQYCSTAVTTGLP